MSADKYPRIFSRQIETIVDMCTDLGFCPGVPKHKGITIVRSLVLGVIV